MNSINSWLAENGSHIVLVICSEFAFGLSTVIRKPLDQIFLPHFSTEATPLHLLNLTFHSLEYRDAGKSNVDGRVHSRKAIVQIHFETNIFLDKNILKYQYKLGSVEISQKASL